MAGVGDRRRQGSLLIISLWLVTILSVLAVAIGRYLSTEVRLARYQLVQARAAALARGGVYAALSLLNAEDENEAYDWLGDEWARFGDDDTWVIEQPLDAANPLRGTQRLEITITDEERKLNFNDVVKRFDNFDPSQVDTQASFQALKAIFDGSREAAVAALDWFDEGAAPLDPTQPTTESDPITGVSAKNKWALSLAEVLSVPGVRQALPAIEQQLPVIQQRLSVVVPGSSESKMNINTVELEILQDLGMTVLYGTLPQCRATEFKFSDTSPLEDQIRNCNPAVNVPQPEIELLAALFSIKSNIFRVVSTSLIIEGGQEGLPRPPVRARVEAIVRRTECEDPTPSPCIVAWSR